MIATAGRRRIRVVVVLVLVVAVVVVVVVLAEISLAVSLTLVVRVMILFRVVDVVVGRLRWMILGVLVLAVVWTIIAALILVVLGMTLFALLGGTTSVARVFDTRIPQRMRLHGRRWQHPIFLVFVVLGRMHGLGIHHYFFVVVVVVIVVVVVQRSLWFVNMHTVVHAVNNFGNRVRGVKVGWIIVKGWHVGLRHQAGVRAHEWWWIVRGLGLLLLVVVV